MRMTGHERRPCAPSEGCQSRNGCTRMVIIEMRCTPTLIIDGKVVRALRETAENDMQSGKTAEF